MNTKGIKFLAVLAVLAMAFAVFAVVTDSETSDADVATKYVDYVKGSDTTGEGTAAKPYQTFDKAINSGALAKGSIIVFMGDYGTAEEPASINLKGIGYTLTSYDSNKKSVITGTISLAGDADDVTAGTYEFKNLAMKLTSPIGFIGQYDEPIATEITLNITNCDVECDKTAVKMKGFSNLNVNIDNSTFAYENGGTAPAKKLWALEVGAYRTEQLTTGAFVVKNSEFCDYPRGLNIHGYSSITADNNYFKMYSGVDDDKPVFQVASTMTNAEISVTNSTIDAVKGKPEFMFNAAGVYTINSLVSDMNIFTDDGHATITINANKKVTIPEGKVFDMEVTAAEPPTTSLVVNGELEINGKLIVGATESVTVEGTGKITNNGKITSKGTITVNGADTATTIDKYGIQGTSGEIVVEAGKLVVEQGSDGNWPIGQNDVKVVKGGSFIVKVAAEEFWGIIGATANTTGEPKDTSAANVITNNKFVFGFSAGAAATNSISVKAIYSTYPTTTGVTYTFNGKVTWGHCNSDGFDYNARNDVFNVTNGSEVTLQSVEGELKGNIIKEKVKVNFDEGAKFVGANANAKIILFGTITYADPSQVYKYTEIQKDEAGKDIGAVKIKGSGSSEETTETSDKTTKTDIEKELKDTTADVVILTGKVTEGFVVPANKTVVIEDASGLTAETVITAKEEGAIVSLTGAGASFALDIGGTKNVGVSGFTGNAIFSKGSIIINGKGVTGATFELHSGDVVKIDGDNAGITFNYGDTTGTAQIIVEKGKTLNLTASPGITIGSASIVMDIEGKVTGGSIVSNIASGTDKVVINAKSGAVIETTAIGGAEAANKKITFNVYSGSDINKIGNINIGWSNVKGKDAASGTWAYNGTDKLTLKNYNGTYNFAKFAATIITIDITGTNSVSYTAPAEFTATSLFGNGGLTTISTDQSGSLEINANLSAVPKNLVNSGFIVLNASTLSIDSVAVAINVTGTNSTWADKDAEKVNAIAISGTTLTLFNAILDIDILSSLSQDTIKGINLATTGTVKVTNSTELVIKSGGDGITTTGATATVTLTNVDLIDVVANKKAVSTNNTIEFTSCVSVMIKGSTNAVTTTGVGAAGKIDIVGSTSISFESSKIALKGTNVTVKTSMVSVKGEAEVTNIKLASGANVNVDGLLKIANAGEETDANLAQESVLEAKHLYVTAGTFDNKGTVVTTGNSVILGTVKNESVFNNTGVLGVFGTFSNVTGGTFTNDGTFNVYAMKVADDAKDKAFAIDDERTSDTKAKLLTIDITEATPIADGSAYIKATLTFDKKTGFVVKDDDKFVGTFTQNQYDAGYALTLSNGTATVSITYVVTDTTKVDEKTGSRYTIVASGALVDEVDGSTVYLENNATGITIAAGADTLKGIFDAATAKLTVTGGKMINNDTVVLYDSNGDFLGASGVYEGDIVIEEGTTDVAISGKFSGNLTAVGNVTVDKIMVGNIISDGNVTVSAEKSMVGDISAKGKVTIAGALLGDVTITTGTASQDFEVSGEFLGTLTFNSEYTKVKDDKEKTVEVQTMNIVADMLQGTGADPKKFIITLTGAVDATSTAQGTPGWFTFGALQAPAETKGVQITLTAGLLKNSSDVLVPAGFEIVIEKDTTIEVAKAAKLDVTAAALKVSKDATANFETGSGIAVTYGKVVYVMSFAIEDGAYTIYSDVAYALINCDEGAELTLGSNATIATNVNVKKGVNIIVDSVELTFDGKNLVMDDGSKITLVGTGKVIFNKSGDNKAIAKEDEEWEFYSNTATIVFGDNQIALDVVRFNADGNYITGVAATSTELAKLDVKLTYNEGAAKLVAGNAAGDIKIGNDAYPKTKADDKATPKQLTKVFGLFYVGENAAFDLRTFSDAMMDASYDDDELTINLMPTIVTIEGVLNVLKNIEVNGVFGGDGIIVLSDDQKITINFGEVLDVEDEIYYGPVFTGVVFDKAGNGFGFKAVTAFPFCDGDLYVPPKADEAGKTLVITADKTNGCFSLTGAYVFGTIDSVTDDSKLTLDGVSIYDDAVLVAETVTLSGDNKVTGLFKNVDLTKKTGAKLDYGAIYTEGAYTVYTVFTSIDFDEVSDVTLTKNFDLADVDAAKVDLSGKDVNITIAEGKTLTVSKILIIGTPITVLGDDEGSSIVGKVIITDNNYLIAYSDVDLTLAEFEGYDSVTDKKKDVVASKLDVEDVPYAAIFAVDFGEETVKLAKADAAIVPDIVGYNFTAWLNYNGDANAKIGETNAYADAKAVLCTVMVKYVAGVDYYMDGVLFNVYDIPTDVPFGSYFTAKISDTTKYQGNPLINGLKTVYVDDDMVLEASGVTPIPEPTPEPAVGDSGLSLTDILLIVLVILIAIMVVILVLRLNRS
jgi:hypothetical protein